jgi:membrane-bound lytic murein transglycosylase D
MARTVERSRRYLYHIVTEVEARGMPLEIALLPIVESAFNPTALSVSRASGIWQFMPATGKSFGLAQTWWFDSRRDVIAATTSALDYLQKLYAEFEDWQLALAAYNWGEGNVRRAVARNRANGQPTDFEHLTRVADETRNYIPKLQAIKNIVADPEKYGLVMAEVPNAPYFTVVRTTVRMDVKLAAELAELDVEEFLALKAHRMKSGETLPQIATRYGLSLETLRSINGIGPRQTVPTGYALLVPMQRPSAEAANSLENAVFTTVPAGRTFYHAVHRGDSLYSIAARYGVTAQELKRWNRLASDRVNVGQRLRVTSDVAPVKSAGKGRKERSAKGKSRGGRSQGSVAVQTKSGGGGRGGKTTAATTAAHAEK